MKIVQYEPDKTGKIHENGKVIEENHYVDGSLLQKIIFDSSVSNGLVKKTYLYTYEGKDSIYLFAIDEKLSYRIDYRRDKFGNLVSTKAYDMLTPSDTVSLFYSNKLNKDNMPVHTSILSNGTKIASNNLLEYTYDNQNRLIEQKVFTVSDSSKLLQDIYQWEYNEKGNNTIISNYNVLQKFTSKTEYDYTLQNEIKTEKYIENTEVIYEINYKYSKSRKIEGSKIYPSSGKKILLKFIYERQ